VEISIDSFLGRSSDETKDLLKVHNSYDGRIPEPFLAICQVNEIDFARDGIYLWQRHNNDLYFDPGEPNKYREQDTDLVQIANSFSEFLNLIHWCAQSAPDDASDDDFDNPNIPFADSDIESDFKHPDLFFKQSETAVAVQLRKLALSEMGRQLLAVFKDRKLI
jgi:hypothetical protein